MAGRVKKFMDGKATPMDMHRRYAWNGKGCTTCGGAPVIRIKTFMKADDFTSTVEPGVMAMIAAACGGKLPTVPTKFGPIVRIGDAYACRACQIAGRAATRASARACLRCSARSVITRCSTDRRSSCSARSTRRNKNPL